MDEQKLRNACQLRDEGRFTEACNEFLQLAEDSEDHLDKAGALLYAANTLEMAGEVEAATSKVSAARALLGDYSREPDENLAALELFLDYEDATLLWLRGGNGEAALNKFDAAIKKHRLRASHKKHAPAPKDLNSLDFYEAIQIRRAFILANLGRWREALPILEAIRSPKEYKEGVAFYLGHCYSSAHDFDRAEKRLTEAIKLGLPSQLEYRAHCELGTVYFNLKDYAKAKEELEKGVKKADPNYIKQSEVYRWLELTCRALGLKAEADHYAQLARPS